MVIEGKITLNDGSESSFLIDEAGGWHQWGANVDRLGRTTAILDAIANAYLDAPDEDGEPTE